MENPHPNKAAQASLGGPPERAEWDMDDHNRASSELRSGASLSLKRRHVSDEEIAPCATNQRAKQAAAASSEGPVTNAVYHLVSQLRAVGSLPSLCVFDLDDTLWRGNCEDFEGAAFDGEQGRAVDIRSGRKLELFQDVKLIFAALSYCGVPIAIASASPAKATALRLLKAFGLPYQAAEVHRMDPHEGKKEHLRALQRSLKVHLVSTCLSVIRQPGASKGVTCCFSHHRFSRCPLGS